MRSIKRLIPFVIAMLILSSLMGCSDVESLNNEVSPDKDNTQLSNSIRPPITKYLFKDDGKAYLADSYVEGGTVIIKEYWVKENGYWVYHKETKELPFSVQIINYPSGGEFGIEYPPHGFTVYIKTADGSLYVMKTGSVVIPVTPDIIRIFKYYVQEEKGGRWYYEDGTKDLLKKDARIL